VGFTNPSYPTIPDAPTSPHNGYEGAWEEYDFSAPDGVPETPDPNVTYDKEVRSVYVPRSFWLYFYFQDNTWDSLSVLVTYGDPIALPAMGTREKTGHVFNGKWQRNDGITDDWTMPAYDLSVNAVWDKDYFTVTVMTGGIEMSFTGDGGEIEILEWSKDKVVIRGQYDTYLDYSYVTPGYTLKDFYLDPAFTQPCGTSRIPAQDITIYARWTESLSVVIMGPFSSYIVNINKIRFLEEERRLHYLALDDDSIRRIPVSKSYYNTLVAIISPKKQQTQVVTPETEA
jgi:hypothetical protein